MSDKLPEHLRAWREDLLTARFTGRRASSINLAADLGRAADEIVRLRTAIAWALGESPPDIPEFTPPEGKHPPYWWRKQLRILSAPTDPTGEPPQGDNTPPLDDGVTFKDGGGGYIR